MLTVTCMIISSVLLSRVYNDVRGGKTHCKQVPFSIILFTQVHKYELIEPERLMRVWFLNVCVSTMCTVYTRLSIVNYKCHKEAPLQVTILSCCLGYRHLLFYKKRAGALCLCSQWLYGKYFRSTFECVVVRISSDNRERPLVQGNLMSKLIEKAKTKSIPSRVKFNPFYWVLEPVDPGLEKVSSQCREFAVARRLCWYTDDGQ